MLYGDSEMDANETTGAALQGGDAAARREAARLMGGATSERKKRSSAANGRLVKNPGRKPRPLESFPCTCGGEGLDHKTTCPRGLAIYRRRNAGKL
jgi:hypothetical protein